LTLKSSGIPSSCFTSFLGLDRIFCSSIDETCSVEFNDEDNAPLINEFVVAIRDKKGRRENGKVEFHDQLFDCSLLHTIDGGGDKDEDVLSVQKRLKIEISRVIHD
jgi:hypothetical protein